MANTTLFTGGITEVPEYIVRRRPSGTLVIQTEDLAAAKAALDAEFTLGNKVVFITHFTVRFAGNDA